MKKGKIDKEKLQKRVDRLKEQVKKMEIQQTDKDENKQIALGTSKLNYLDPRISIAWCKKVRSATVTATAGNLPPPSSLFSMTCQSRRFSIRRNGRSSVGQST